MNDNVKRETLGRTASDYYWPIYHATDSADWRESLVLYEDTLDARAIMGEATKGSRRIKSQK